MLSSGSGESAGVSGSAAASLKMTVGNLREFDPNVNKWNVYKKQVSQFFLINNITDSKLKRAFLLNSLSENAFSILCDLLIPQEPEIANYDEIVNKLDEHFCVKKSVWGERMLFYQAHQENSECIADWAIRVRHLSTNCEFGNVLNMVIRDKFIFGMQKCRALEKLLQESSTTLEFQRAVEIAQSVESAKNYFQENTNVEEPRIKRESEIHRVSQAARGASSSWRVNQRPTTAFQRKGQHRNDRNQTIPGAGMSKNVLCTVCGKDNHTFSNCRYKNFICNNCHERGHLANVCKKRSSNKINKNSHKLTIT